VPEAVEGKPRKRLALLADHVEQPCDVLRIQWSAIFQSEHMAIGPPRLLSDLGIPVLT
jgi:hypothetical protein